ncbi:MAG: methionyl-tRNA formyltransferase [Acidobacteria bacterium]|nr:methionyl-tRNA formyltransferase [Acidobacteriota bacterium]
MDLRIVFLGTPEFAVPSLEALAEWKREAVVGVISQPDRPQGRGRSVVETPVKKAARAMGLPVFQPAKIKSPEVRELVGRLNPDLVVVVAYGQILPGWFLRIPRCGAVNVHASLLPRYRGAAPLQRAVMNGEAATGITLMLMDEGMDTGPVLSQMEFPIGENETSGELLTRASRLAADFLVRELPRYLDDGSQPVPQDAALATYAPSLKKEEGRIRFGLSSSQLHNLVRAMNPWPTAVCQCQDRPLLVHRTRHRQDAAGAEPGEMIEVDQDAVWVQCGSGSLALVQVQSPGRRIISGRDFANGLRLGPGFRFADG